MLGVFSELRSIDHKHALRFGVPNQGRLRAEVREALGWREWTADSRTLTFESDGILVVLARSTDLPNLVEMGALDACVTGHDYVVESGVEPRLRVVKDLGIQRTRLCVVRRDDGEKFGEGQREITVVSQYPNIARNWVNQHPQSSRMKLVPIDGAAEMYVSMGMADLAIDAVMTGKSLLANGMRIAETLMESSGRIYSSRDLFDRRAASRQLVHLATRIEAALQ